MNFWKHPLFKEVNGYEKGGLKIASGGDGLSLKRIGTGEVLGSVSGGGVGRFHMTSDGYVNPVCCGQKTYFAAGETLLDTYTANGDGNAVATSSMSFQTDDRICVICGARGGSIVTTGFVLVYGAQGGGTQKPVSETGMWEPTYEWFADSVGGYR